MSPGLPAIDHTEADIYAQYHPKETPEILAEKLKTFKQEIATFLTSTKDNEAKEAIEGAQEKCPELLTDDFLLWFLRCEVFHVDCAVERYAKYWKKRVVLFGTKAYEPLTLDKALSNDKVALEMGFGRILPVKDPQGRSVLFVDPSRQDLSKYERESMTRCLWYVLHTILAENEISQQRGVIFIACPKNTKVSQFDRKGMSMNMESMQGCIPVRMSAIHICHPPWFFATVVFPIMSLFLHKRLKKRVLVHAGASDEKVIKKLTKYGFTAEKLPTDMGGVIALDHLKWLEEQRASGK